MKACNLTIRLFGAEAGPLPCRNDRVEEKIIDRDEDDESDGVDVVNQIVRSAVKFYRGRLRDQVARHLVVCKPVERNPEKDGASFKATTDFVDS